jgi:hypothetical protein
MQMTVVAISLKTQNMEGDYTAKSPPFSVLRFLTIFLFFIDFA